MNGFPFYLGLLGRDYNVYTQSLFWRPRRRVPRHFSIAITYPLGVDASQPQGQW